MEQNSKHYIAMATKQPAECREVVFPRKCTSAEARKKHKEQVLKQNPEVLYTDFTVQRGKRVKCNLIFHTNRVPEWTYVLCKHYDHIRKEGIGRGGRLTICEDETLNIDDPQLTISYYKKGTVLVQGNDNSLSSFEKAFPMLKAEVESGEHTAEEQVVEEKPVLTPPPPASPSSDKQYRDHWLILS